MAGIGFELRKVLKKGSLLSLGKMYAYSGILSSGPWVISILAIILVGFINITAMSTMEQTVQFQVVITYAIALASSLIITGTVQLPYTRYVADTIFAGRKQDVLSSYFGTLFIVWLTGVPIIWMLVTYAFPLESTLFKMEVVTVFLVLCAVWISNVLATSLKFFKGVVLAYFVSYGLIVLFSYLIPADLQTLLIIFIVGNVLLLALLMSFIALEYDSKEFMHFRFFDRKKFYWKLGLAGLFYNLGTWIDKFIFWYHPLTGHAVIGKVNASVVYDLPIFMAYLSIIPGMAIFFYRLESDFAEWYDKYFEAVRKDGTLALIEEYRNEMATTIRHAMREIIVYQGIIDIIIFLVAPSIFHTLKIPMIYLDLFFVLTVGALLQLGFMSVLAILFYLDRRSEAMWLSILFFILNAFLTWQTIYMGPSWFGYGYAVSLLIVFSLGLWVLEKVMENMDYETFMLR
ncbi:exopolysaccharide Pel transporter PelG [Hydrogenimonas sp.]|uniref:exopolysaccharide Pel transporter PelG n=1 Tax=Hydrogenimonas sp. TaxID=2231112 RepID=UPI00260EEBFD|nr:exopolysaccharide Pel transporter PelG [Hydrogenimonas sp.]